MNSYNSSNCISENSIYSGKCSYLGCQKFNLYPLLFILCLSFSCYCSLAQSCPTLCDSMDCSTPGFPIVCHLLELAQTHVHWAGDAIQPFCSLSSPSLPCFNLSQHQGLFKWGDSSHQVAKLLELKHQSFQWIFRSDFL